MGEPDRANDGRGVPRGRGVRQKVAFGREWYEHRVIWAGYDVVRCLDRREVSIEEMAMDRCVPSEGFKTRGKEGGMSKFP